MRYYLGLGGNLGDVAASMATAVETLRARGYDVPLISSCYATAPMGDQAGDSYLNAVLGVDSDRTPLEMLRECQEIENDCGRVRTATWGPRTLDIDLLLAGHETLQSRFLTLPHPGLIYRRFALDPLCEIARDLRHPGLGVTISEMRRWLLPRPLHVTIRTKVGEDLSAIVSGLPSEIRERVRLHHATGRVATLKEGWLLDCVEPCDAARPCCVSLARLEVPVDGTGPLLTAMTDEPRVVPSPKLDRVRLFG